MKLTHCAVLIALAVASVGGLAACSATSTVTPAQVAQDVSLLESGIIGAFKSPVLANTPPAIQAALADLQGATTAFAAADTVAAAQPVVTRIEADVNALVAFAATVPGLPPNVASVFAAAQVLLPVIEAGVNMVVPASAPSASMTPGSARLILRAATH